MIKFKKGTIVLMAAANASRARSQISFIPFDGGEARSLTNLESSIESFRWSRDGKQFVCTLRQKDQRKTEEESNENKQKLGMVSCHITRERFKSDGIGFVPIILMDVHES